MAPPPAIATGPDTVEASTRTMGSYGKGPPTTTPRRAAVNLASLKEVRPGPAAFLEPTRADRGADEGTSDIPMWDHRQLGFGSTQTSGSTARSRREGTGPEEASGQQDRGPGGRCPIPIEHRYYPTDGKLPNLRSSTTAMSKLLYCALFVALTTLLACSGPGPAT